MAIVDDGEVTLLSRNGADITRTFPEITAALLRGAPVRSFVFDALHSGGNPP
jgi:ATP-dependent DNA ligase